MSNSRIARNKSSKHSSTDQSSTAHASRKSAPRSRRKVQSSHSSLSARQRETEKRARALRADLRRGKGSFTALSRKHHIDPRTARKYLGDDLIGGKGTPVRARKTDQRVRLLMFPKSVGDVPVRIRGSKNATKLSEYYRDRAELLRGKLSPREFEAKWQRARIAGKEVFSDTAEIFRIASAGALKMENLYASTGGAK